MVRPLLVSAVIALGLASAAPALAQADRFDAVEITAQTLTPNIHVLFGDGGNIGVVTGEDGAFLIDDQYAPLTEKISAAVAKLTDQPIRFVLNTHWHFDHTGGNENFGKAGALIVAHDNVYERMSTEQVMAFFGNTRPPSPKDALPVITFSETSTFRLNGETIRAIHVPHAHTDGDAIVHFTGSNVLHMGDTYFHQVTFPFIDRDSGGSIDGLIAAVELGLSLADDATQIIPGHGPVASKADMAAYRDMLKDIREKVAARIAAGDAREAIVESGLANAYAAGGMATGFIKPAIFVGFVHDSLKAPPETD